MKVWISPYIWERRIELDRTDWSELRLWSYTKVPVHYDRSWCFLRIWIVCFQWL